MHSTIFATSPTPGAPTTETFADVAKQALELYPSVADADERRIEELDEIIAGQGNTNPRAGYTGTRGWVTTTRRALDEREFLRRRRVFIAAIRAGVADAEFGEEDAPGKNRDLLILFLRASASEGPSQLLGCAGRLRDKLTTDVERDDAEVLHLVGCLAGVRVAKNSYGNPAERCEVERRVQEAAGRVGAAKEEREALDAALAAVPAAWSAHVGQVAASYSKIVLADWNSKLNATGADAIDFADPALKDLQQQLSVAESKVTETLGTLAAAGGDDGEAAAVLRNALVTPVVTRIEARQAEIARERVVTAQSVIADLAPALAEAASDQGAWAKLIVASKEGKLPHGLKDALVEAAASAFVEAGCGALANVLAQV